MSDVVDILKLSACSLDNVSWDRIYCLRDRIQEIWLELVYLQEALDNLRTL